MNFFSKIVFVDFIEEITVIFLTKHYQLLQCFFFMGFFPSKIICHFFNIKLVENLALYFFCFLLMEKLNYMGKTLYLSSQNTVDCYKSFCSVSKFLIINTTFFSVIKYWFHHTFNFYYLFNIGSQL
jgi:hypothetical protein